MSNYVRTKHDIGFLRQDGSTTVGLVLARDKNGNPIYRSHDDEYLATQQTTGTPGYGNLPPEKELVIAQTDWRSGFGQEFYDSTDPKRYYRSINCDARHKGMVILGPLPTTVTKPSGTSLSITNADMEGTDGWNDNYRSDEQAHGGTYSWKHYYQTSTYQDLTWDNAYRGCYFKFSIWIYQLTASTATLIIDDGVGTTSSATTATINSWVQVTVGRQLSATATRLRLTLNNAGASGDTAYFDDVVVESEPTVGAVADFVEFNDNLYAAFGGILAKLNGTGTAFTTVGSFPENISSLKVFGSALYIGQGISAAYYEMSTSEVFTLNTLTDNTHQFFESLYTTAQTMYGNDTANVIYSTTNPADGGTNWGSATTIDSATYAITGLIQTGNVLYIMKEDRPFYLDSSGDVKVLIEDLKTLESSTSGKNSIVWLEDLFIPCGDQGLVQYDTSESEPIWRSPSKFCTNLAEFVGQVQATAKDEEYLYIAVDYSDKIEIMAGRLETIDGITKWVWHSLVELTLAGCNKLFTSTVYKKRLWVASTDSSDSVYYVPLTTKYGDITSDTDYTFNTGSAYLETPWMHADFRADDKAFIKITLTMEDTTANVYWEAHYKKLGDSSWTDIGDFKTSPTTSAYLPVDGSSNNPVSTMMKFKFVPKTNSSGSTPKLMGYDVRAILYPSNRRIIECAVECGNGYVLKDGTREEGQSATIKAAIIEAREATWPVTFYDIDYEEDPTDIYVKFLPTQSMARPIERDRKLERYYYLRLQVVPLS